MVTKGSVVVYNPELTIPLRHVVLVQNYEGIEEFKKWYYTIYHEIPGDRFEYCPTTIERTEVINRINNVKG